MGVVQIQREIPFLVVQFRRLNRFRVYSVKIFRGLALHENGIGANIEDLPHPKHVGFGNMLQCSDKTAFGRQLLVPPAVTAGKQGADVHFVHWRVELNERKSLCECPRITCKKLREIRILKIANPIRHSEMAQIRDGYKPASFQFKEGFVRKGPVKAFRPQEGPVQRRTIPEKADAELLDLVEVRFPILIMPAFLHFIDSHPPVLDRWIAVLYPGCEHECWRHFQTPKYLPVHRSIRDPRYIRLQVGLPVESQTGQKRPIERKPRPMPGAMARRKPGPSLAGCALFSKAGLEDGFFSKSPG